MNDVILTSIITGLSVAIPSIVATIVSHKSNEEKNRVSNELVLYRIDKLEEKVNKHNNIVERITLVEKDLEVISKEIIEMRKSK